MTDNLCGGGGYAAPRLHANWMIASGNYLFRVRNVLFPLIFLVVMIVTRPAQFMNNAFLDSLAMVEGAGIALAGQAFRAFVIGYAYIKRGGKGGKVYANDLVVAGLYSHTRNPMYVGNFLLALGFGIFYGSIWMYVLVIPFFAWTYLAITAAEEQYLVEKFGLAYEQYMKRVNRFVPNFDGLSDSLAGYTFRWREVLAKEYNTMFATFAGLILIAMWKIYYLHGWEMRKEQLLRIAWLLVPCILFSITVRFLKLTGRLKQPVVAAVTGIGVDRGSA